LRFPGALPFRLPLAEGGVVDFPGCPILAAVARVGFLMLLSPGARPFRPLLAEGGVVDFPGCPILAVVARVWFLMLLFPGALPFRPPLAEGGVVSVFFLVAMAPILAESPLAGLRYNQSHPIPLQDHPKKI